MSAVTFEAFLARIYVDAEAREQFLADPRGKARSAGLTDEESEALANIDRVGLELAANSFARKRATQENNKQKRKPSRWLRAFLRNS